MKFALHRKMCKVIKSSAFWDTTRCILVKINRLLRETYCVHLHGQLSFAACFILVSSLASSETSVHFQWPTQRCRPEKTVFTFKVRIVLRASRWLVCEFELPDDKAARMLDIFRLHVWLRHDVLEDGSSVIT
jgi:hypothetical protein